MQTHTCPSFYSEIYFNFYGGRYVILYSVVRKYDVSMAKATVQTSNPSVVVGGTHLGVKYSEFWSTMCLQEKLYCLVHMEW